jgi:uncharacterized membrane protein YkvI
LQSRGGKKYLYFNFEEYIIIIIIIIIIGLRLSPLGTVATIGQLYPPQMIEYGDCEAIGGIKIGG